MTGPAAKPEAQPSLAALSRKWRTDDPRRLVGPGHPVGDFLEAHEWEVLEEREGYLRLSCHLPPQVKNPRGDLFGGFTPTYADFAAVFTGRAGRRHEPPTMWLNTASLTMDYFWPITGHFFLESEVLHRTGRTYQILIRFTDEGGRLLALSRATLIESPRPSED